MLRAAAVLGKLDFLLPEPRASLAPLVSELANLGYTPEGFSRLDGTSQRVLTSAAIHLASRKLEQRARELAKEAERQADRKVLVNAASGMQEIKTYFPMYLQPGSLQGLERSHAKAAEKLTALLAARLEEEVGRGIESMGGANASEALSVPGSEQAQQTPAVQEAKALVKSLLDLDEVGQRKALVEWMLDLVGRDREEASHRIVVRGLLEELGRTAENPYPLREIVLRAFEEIGLKTPFESVRELVMRGLADSLFGPEGVYYSQLALQSFRVVAVHSPSRRTKGLALALLERELASASLEGYGEKVRDAQKERIRRIMDRIRDSAGEEALEPPPVPAKPQPPQGKKPGLLAELRQWARRHPLGAFFLFLAGTVASLAGQAFPALGIAGVAAILIYLGVSRRPSS